MASYAGKSFTGVVAAGVAALIHAGGAFAGCKLGNIADLPVTMVDMKPMVKAQINGEDALFVADSGAFYSMMSPAGATQHNLRTYPAPFGLFVSGIGGTADVSIATVKVFTLAGVPVHNVEFLVGGGEAGGGGVGLLGQNVFRIADVEYDLAKGVIRLMREVDCGKTSLVYWAAPSQAYSMMPIQPTTPLSPHTTGSAVVNGVTIRVTFDTGEPFSSLSVSAAAKAGIKTDAPGVHYVGYSWGIGRGHVKTWIAPVASFKLGDEEIRNTRLRLSESLIESVDMLIGADFFLSHHLYVASKQNKLYFTYNGGPVFNLTTAPPPSASPPSAPPPSESPSGSAQSEPPAGTALEPTAPGAAAVASDTPQDAAGFSRRGTASAARRDFAHAIADLTRACELAPENADYFYERGIAHWENKEPVPAMDDLTHAIELAPGHVPALVARAELRIAAKNVPQAREDLEAADRAAAKEADARLRMGYAYFHADLLDAAIPQLDLWIAAHEADARMAGALSERCWARVLSGEDLKKALDDCNSAVSRTDKKDQSRAHYLDGRALVHLRLGEYDKSIADYDASLALNPKNAGALYGRGVDKLRRGKASEGQADVDAAKALFPTIADAYAKRGITP